MSHNQKFDYIHFEKFITNKSFPNKYITSNNTNIVFLYCNYIYSIFTKFDSLINKIAWNNWQVKYCVRLVSEM